VSLGALAVLLASSAAAQSPMYGAPAAAPAASTATVTSSTSAVTASSSTVTASTATASIDDVAGHGFKVGGGAPKAKLSRPMHAIIHKDAVDWEPLSLRVGGVPGSSDNAVSLRVVKVNGRMKGANTSSRPAVQLHKGAKDSRWLVISIHPKSLEKKRTHFEIRFRIFEGYVEELEAAAVTVTDRSRSVTVAADSYNLRDDGIEYQEERPGSGQIIVSELDPRAGKGSLNSGRLEKAEFADKDFGFVNLSWSVKGVRAAGK
jgi:hypothetical protein